MTPLQGSPAPTVMSSTTSPGGRELVRASLTLFFGPVAERREYKRSCLGPCAGGGLGSDDFPSAPYFPWWAQAWTDRMRHALELDVVVSTRCGGRIPVSATSEIPGPRQRNNRRLRKSLSRRKAGAGRGASRCEEWALVAGADMRVDAPSVTCPASPCAVGLDGGPVLLSVFPVCVPSCGQCSGGASRPGRPDLPLNSPLYPPGTA